MSQNIIEYLREVSINRLFSTKGFNKAWPTWQTKINTLAPAPTQYQLLSLGDNLKDIFYTTNTSTSRSQSDVSGGEQTGKPLFVGILIYVSLVAGRL